MCWLIKKQLFFIKYFVLSIVIIILSANYSFSQTMTEGKVKAMYIFNFGNLITWENEETIDTFRIGIYGENPELFAELKILSETDRIKNKPTLIFQVPEKERIADFNLFYITQDNNFELKRIIKKAKNLNTLLVTNQNKKPELIMINFLIIDNKIKFEINKKNISTEGFKINPKILLSGGSFVDVSQLYTESEESLKSEKEKSELQKKEILIQESELKKQRQEITNQKNTITNQKQLISTQKKNISSFKAELKVLNNDINKQTETLNKRSILLKEKQNKIINQESIINSKESKIKGYNNDLSELSTSISAKQNKIIEQKKILKNQTLRINLQQNMLIIFITFSVLVLGLVYFILRGFYQKKEANKKLEAKNSAISQQNAQIILQKEEIQSQTDNLVEANISITKQKEKLENAYTNVKLLSDIGKKITAQLTFENISKTVFKNVNSLLEVDKFRIGTIEIEKNELCFIDYESKLENTPVFSFPLVNKNSLAVHCILNKKEIILGDIRKEYKQFIDNLDIYKESDLLRSIMIIPLLNDKNSIGVIIVQSKKRNAYSDYHINVLRNIGNYISIALQNTNAYEKISVHKHEIELQRDELGIANATKDKFFSIIAHDLKNPFNTLIGFSDMLVNRFDDFEMEEIMEIIHDINSASHKGHNLLDNLLLWSRSQTGRINFEPQRINLKNIVNDNVLLAKETADSKNIRLINSVVEDIYSFIDVNMISTVIRNLLSNALKFTDKNGNVNITVQKKAETIEVEISDTGVGIDKEDIKKLFRIDVSHSTKGTAKEKGSGLGLILCKEFINIHGGEISIESEKGVGSKFMFTIPFVAVN